MKILMYTLDHISLVKMGIGKMTFESFFFYIYTMYCENGFTDFFIEPSKKMSLIENLAQTENRELRLQVKKIICPIYKNFLTFWHRSFHLNFSTLCI
jgi:hypothetical protein